MLPEKSLVPCVQWAVWHVLQAVFFFCPQEYERRFSVWLDNLEYAHAHNEQQKSYWVGGEPVSSLGWCYVLCQASDGPLRARMRPGAPQDAVEGTCPACAGRLG